MKISLFASAIRPHLWPSLLDSLKSNKCEYEVIFAGYIESSLAKEITDKYSEFKYITTLDIKPAQCYEIARIACRGEIIAWISDDCVFPEGALDKILKYWEHNPSKKDILAIKTHDPECTNNDLNDQRFFSRNLNTPQMAVIGFISNEYLQELGGLDRRYIYGKFEYDICMRALADGGKIIKYEDFCIKIEHTQKNAEYTNDWSGVNEDSETLENSWVIGGYKDFEKPIYSITENNIVPYFPISNREVTLKRLDEFEPFEDKDILEKSQGKNKRGL